MADVIKTWKTGDVIQAEDMNVIGADAANAMSLSRTDETHAVWFRDSDGTMSHDTLATNSTGESIALTSDQTFRAGTSPMFVTENDIQEVPCAHMF